MKGICVRSEIKPLKKVLLHRPGRELLHLTPDRLPELLFDDIPFLKVAQQEHDTFAQILRSNGTEVVYLEDLMAEVLKLHPEQTKPFLYQWLSEGNIKTRRWQDKLYEYLIGNFEGKALVEKTMEGITLKEMGGASAYSLQDLIAPADDLIVDPMPNLYFTRDPFASVGTGVILTEDGYIITNAHVIAGGTSCYVALADGSIFDAALVGYDAEQDLAVIKAQDTDGRTAQGLLAAEFGDSDALSVGDPVYAIGNPLGVELRGTLTDGIVSAINRDVDVDGVTMTLIQTNAALNNGNSGGPLINQYGQVIGINVMKMGMDRWSTASVEGLGFAIPIASSAYIVNDILRCGEVQGEPVLGISVDRTPAYLPDGQQAARVYTVDLNGPGDKAGLEVDDLIYEADGVRVETSNDLLRVRHRHAAGEEMILKVCRGGEYLTVSVTLEAKK